jgi:GrpB-like predicted nucleotidyltransferase (UPF0157 family)
MTDGLGLPSGAVIVVPYNPTWPLVFGVERTRIERVLSATDLSLAIEHIGSTSVPGLAAKPVLDIMGGCREEDEMPAMIDALIDAGYIHRGPQGIPDREFFRLGNPRRIHLHLTVVGSQFWKSQLTFRDYLRSHEDGRNEYARLKCELAANFPRDRAAYIEAKGAWIQSVLATAITGTARRVPPSSSRPPVDPASES